MKTLDATSPAPTKFSHANPMRVCFVCTGNTCRSPMAEAVLNHKTRIIEGCSACDPEEMFKKKPIRATSAGLFALGDPINPLAVEALEKAGIPSLSDNYYRGHVSRSLDAETLEACHLIIGLTGDHAMRMMAMYPAYASKITCFPEDIPDPYGGTAEDYDRCLGAIRRGIDDMFFPEERL